MNIRRQTYMRGFTLIEVMVAMGLMTLLIGSVYTTWMSVVKASKVGLSAAAAAQRERMATKIVEEALSSAQMFSANSNYYAFEADGDKGELSFTARLGEDFPRSGKFNTVVDDKIIDFKVRRVMFSLEPGHDGQKQLVMRQRPVLAEDLDETEQRYPVVLAKDVEKFTVECWDTKTGGWSTDQWLQTNILPSKVRFTLQLNYAGAVNGAIREEAQPRVVPLIPSPGAQAVWQSPNLPGGGGQGGGQGGTRGGGGNPGGTRGGGSPGGGQGGGGQGGGGIRPQ